MFTKQEITNSERIGQKSTKHVFTIVCRASPLSRIQAEKARERIMQIAPQCSVQILAKDSAGDKNRSTPLYALEGRDFFTKDIDDCLHSGEVDFAVHSLKDLSLERMEDTRFVSAVFEREDPRDVVLFSPDAVQKLAKGELITLGTSSLRRMELVPPFLERALPQSDTQQSGRQQNPAKPRVQCLPMRGNVDSRLSHVQEGKFDGAVLAAAGVNRLLCSDVHKARIRAMLEGFRFMLLPLVECTPAPGQGALLLEALAHNAEARAIVARLHNTHCETEVQHERELLRTFGGGCHQRFGAVSVRLADEHILIANGTTQHGTSAELMRFPVPEHLLNKRIFAASDYMRDFFTTEYYSVDESFTIAENAVFVSHHRAAYTNAVLRELRSKRVWTAGTRTWFELANRGVWVEGCSDGFGLRFLDDAFASPLVGIEPKSMRILTNTDSATDWQREGYHATGLYTLHDSVSTEIQTALHDADACFWTSFGQYRACQNWVREDVIHLCPSGRTAERFRAEGMEPITFPSIKAFLFWQQHHSNNNHSNDNIL